MVGCIKITLEIYTGIVVTVRDLPERKDPEAMPLNYEPWEDDKDNTIEVDPNMTFGTQRI